MKNSYIKSPTPHNQSGSIGLNNSTLKDAGKIDYPVFCFKHLHKSYNIKECILKDKRFAKDILNKIETLTQKTWSEIQLTNRQAGGSEKIAKDSLRKEPPTTITEDVDHYLSFYFSGDKGRLIGYRGRDNIFHIVFIDTDLSLYTH